MIRIKAPRVWRIGVAGYRPSYYRETRFGAEPGRWISEATYRRVLALVRACERRKNDSGFGYAARVLEELEALRAQAEKEAGK